jgi:hypothetical protein
MKTGLAMIGKHHPMIQKAFAKRSKNLKQDIDNIHNTNNP